MNWYNIAKGYVGVHEEKGTKHNPLVVSMWKNSHIPWIRDDETPWCAAFVGSCLEEAGLVSSRSAAALSYKEWGIPLNQPFEGAVAFMERKSGKRVVGGHVAFVAGVTQDGMIMLLGGNQGDSVSIKAFNPNRILGYRWPAGVKVVKALPVFLTDDYQLSQKET